jgi:hypothetical protein
MGYIPALPDDCRRHRRYHAAWMKPRRPKPDPRIAALVANSDAPGDANIVVDTRSPLWLHKRVFEIAQALKRDEGYDFTQWSETGEQARSNQTHAILFVEPAGIVIGAAAFSFMAWENHPPGWHMNFVWIAEPWRRRGQLSRRWAGFRERYGAFTLDHPLSEAMESFATKHGIALD